MSLFDGLSSLLGGTTTTNNSNDSITRPSGDRCLLIRRNLLISLKNCVLKLTPLLHKSDEGKKLDENIATVYELCNALEHCLLHGIKVKEFHGVVPFWGLLERLETLQPPCLALRNSVGAVACIPSLRTPIAKARGWIRQVLNVRGLEESLSVIVKQNRLLPSFYMQDSIMCHPEEVTALVAVVRSLKVYSFNLTVDNPELNKSPEWLTRLMQHQTPPSAFASKVNGQTSSPSRNTQIENNSPPAKPGNHSTSDPSSNSGSAFDAFFSLVEQGFDVVVDQVDAYATKAAQYLNEKLEASEGGSKLVCSEDELSLHYRTPFFGSPLQALVLDESRCGHARLEPRLGIPTQTTELLDFVEKHIHTEGLFRLQCTPLDLMSLREILESGNSIPEDVSPHIAIQSLLQWLYDLEEPLLGYEHYDAIQSCMELEVENDRIRNLSLLVMQAPWWHLPLLLRVVSLLHTACLPENSEQNGLNIVILAVVATPFMLRPRPAGSSLYARSRSLGQCVERDPEERDREHLAAAAVGSTVMEFILSKQEEIFQPLRSSMTQIQEALDAKCTRVKELQEQLVSSLDCFPTPFFTATSADLEEDGAREGESLSAHNLPHSIQQRCKDQCLLAAKIWVQLARVEKHRVKLSNPNVGSPSSTATPTPMPTPAPSSSSFTVESVDEEEEEDKEGATATATTEGSDVKYVNNNSSNSEHYRFLAQEIASSSDESPGRSTAAATTTTAAIDPDEAALRHALAVSPVELSLHPRWALCGFPAGQPLKDFHSCGMLACHCLLGFLTRFGDKASLLVLEFVQKRLRYCSLPQVCCQLTVFVADALCLLPTPESPEAPLSVAYIAKRHSWSLLSDEKCFQEVFDISLLTFDDLWRHYTDQLGHTPNQDTLQLCLFSCRTLLTELLRKSPRNIEQLWQLWTEQRVHRQQLVVEAHMRLPRVRDHSHRSRAASLPPAMLAATSSSRSGSSSSSHRRSGSRDDRLSFTPKIYCGLRSHVVGGSEILTAHHIDEIEPALPVIHQCCDWVLMYRMSRDGASLSTLLRIARQATEGKRSGGDTSNPTLLVLRDEKGVVLGGFAPETWRDMGERYYGNGTAAVWSFVSGGLQYYPSAQKNAYYMLTSEDSLAMGGGGDFALFLDGDLNQGSSGPCETYASPCLASSNQFVCTACELFALKPASFSKE